MTHEEMLERMPQFAAGTLPPQQAMSIARALKDSPELLEELQFALSMRVALQAWEAPEPLSAARTARLPLPDSLQRGTNLLRDAMGLVGGSLQLARKLI